MSSACCNLPNMVVYESTCVFIPVLCSLYLQVFAESKDEVAVVLFGTNGTRNDLASEDQYQNITVHRSLKLPDFDLLEDIQDVIKAGSEQADCILLLQNTS